jgi:hypothetical protein
MFARNGARHHQLDQGLRRHQLDQGLALDPRHACTTTALRLSAANLRLITTDS